jgi:hypothetical protein
MVLKRLAQNFEHVARKLRQLVQKQQTIVRQRHLARPRNDASANQPGIGDGVVRRAERALRHQAGSRVEHAGYGVNLGGFQRFVEGERRENRRQPLGKHGFSGAGRADHENVMAAGRGNFESALGGLLAAHIFEVDGKMLQLAEQRLSRHTHRLALDLADHSRVQQIEHVEQRRDGIDIHALHHRRLGRVGRRHKQVGNTFLARQDGDGQHAGNGANTAVKAELTYQQKAAKVAAHVINAQRAVCAENTDGNWKVEA